MKLIQLLLEEIEDDRTRFGNLNIMNDGAFKGQLFNQIDLLKGDLFVDNVSIISDLSGFPEKVTGEVDIRQCHNLQMLEGSLMSVGHEFSLFDLPKLTSLSGIGRKFITHFSEPQASMWLSTHITSSILGVMTIKGGRLTSIFGNGSGELIVPDDLIKACKIMMTHLQKHEPDMLDCKEELMNNGLREFAKL